MRPIARLLAAAALLAPLRAQDPDPFPVAAPEDVGLPAQALAELAAAVRGFVERDEIVGAELLVIKGDKRVLHESFGWQDREAGLPMPKDALFSVRSMTKPVIGTAVAMLLEDSKLELDEPVATYLPSFENDKSRAITVRQLLHHTGGLPLSGLLGGEISRMKGVCEIAAAVGASGPQHPPGSGFHYSDAGADTLGALVEVVSGEPLGEFLRQRIFAPLGMSDALTFVAPDEPRRSRIASAYTGEAGGWTRYWSSADAPLFPFAMGSQGLYCSARDYARFLSLWKGNGRHADGRLLRMSSCKRALTPGTQMDYSSGFEGCVVHYGELWMLYIDQNQDPQGELYAFGHGGSDGTAAWVFPALDLMVLYFTQSRGNTTFPEFETTLQRALLDPLLGIDRAPPVAYSQAEIDALLGHYWDEADRNVRTLLRKGAGLWAEIPGVGVLELVATSTRDRWVLAVARDIAGEIERDAEGRPTALIERDLQTGRTARAPRLTPDPSLPSVDEVMALRKQAVDWERLEELGALRWTGTVDMSALKLQARVVGIAVGLARQRLDTSSSRGLGSVVVDGVRGWQSNSQIAGGAPSEVDPAMRERVRLQSFLLPITDWRSAYRELQVLTKAEFRGREVYYVRAVPELNPARTFMVDVQTGLLSADRAIQALAGLGEIGVLTSYDDWRGVDGIRLPFHILAQFHTPLLGTFETCIEQVETHVELAPGFFDMPARK